MIPTTGTITLHGKECTWTSPKLKHLMEVENLVGPITDLKIVNSVRGRVYLAYACLRDSQPEMTPGVLMDLPAAAFEDLWTMIRQAIPLYGFSGAEGAETRLPPVPPEGAETSPLASPEASSLPSISAKAGTPSEPEGSG